MRELNRLHVIYLMDSRNEPAMVVASGETVVVQTQDCYGGKVSLDPATYDQVSADYRSPATGPVFIRGAEPGDALEVLIKGIRLPQRGLMVLRPGIGVLGKGINELSVEEVTIKGSFAFFRNGIRIPLRPMVGVIGVAPQGQPVSTRIPGSHGGNMDTSDIGVGIRLSLPVQVKGALLSLGDVHAAMGDGEASGTGVEVSAEVTIQMNVLKGTGGGWPRVETADSIITIASHGNLMTAISLATEEMVSWITQKVGLSLEEAILLIGAAGDVRISQLVNPSYTARVVMAKVWSKERRVS